MSSSDGITTCDKSGNGSGKVVSVSTSNKKECTSCEQKVDNCKDGASDNTSGDSCNSDIGAVAKSISRVDLSNDDNNTSGSCSAADINGIFNGVENEAISDEKLFGEPPTKEDCPICMLPMPYSTGLCGVRTTYQPCCGMTICEGCVLASTLEVIKGNLKPWCSFCRTPRYRSNKEQVQRFEERMKLNDAGAFHRLGVAYSAGGEWGLPKNNKKAVELWNRAAELGSLDAHYELARAYHSGKGVEFDMDETIQHLEIAAVGGYEMARHLLGLIEAQSGNIDRSMKHFMIAARSGNAESLKVVGEGYKDRYVTKDEYAKTLRAYQHSCDEMKSEQRLKPQEVRDNPDKVRQGLLSSMRTNNSRS